MTGGTPVQPLNDAYDSFDVSVTSKALKPELKFSYNANPDYIPAPMGSVVDSFSVAKTRNYDEEVSFTVTATADPANTADYYFWSGTAPGIFSAPYQPGPSTTGPNNQIWQQLNGSPVTLSAYTGPMTITADGTVIENAIFNNIGALRIKAKNCVVRNCKLFSDNTFYNLISNLDECENLIVEDCEFSGTGTFQTAQGLKTNSALILAGGDGSNRNATIRRCYFHDAAADFIKADGNCLIESNYFYHFGDVTLPGAPHCDCVQQRGGDDLYIRWNYFDIPAGDYLPTGRIHSAACIIQGETDIIRRTVIDSNWFKGGSNAITLQAQDYETEVFIINNKYIGSESDITSIGYHPYFENWLVQKGGGSDLYDIQFNAYNNKMYDGSPAPLSNDGPNQAGAGGTVLGYMDNLTSPPDLPFYDGPGGSKVDLSDGITLRISADELSKQVKIYSEATNTDGVFVDGDSVSGFLVSGDVRSGDDLGTTLQVCSTLSAHTVIFEDAGIGRTGLGVGELTIEDYNQRIELPPVGGETSSTTGPRIAVTDHPHHDICWFVDPGQSNASNKIEVPAAGLVVSGYAFKEVRIKTSNTLKFIDCEFSGQTDCHNGVVQQYTVWDNNQGGEGINRKVDFEYCDFQGGGSVTLMMNFRKLHKCRFDNVLSDYIRFRSGSYRITNCWFGSYMKAPDSALNGNNGHYNENQGINPHADPMQNFLTNNPIICIYDCTFNLRPATWSDGSINPEHERGAYPDKIMQIGGTTANSTESVIGECRFWNCILNGGGNYMLAGPGPNKMVTPATFTFKDCKFGTSFRSGHFGSLNNHHSRVDLGGNVWLETGTPVIRLPQEALDAGTTTNLGRNNLPISYVIRGLDNVSFNADGLNEGGKTSWGQRGIGWV